MPIQVLQRDVWHGEPRRMGETFRMKKGRLEAECQLWPHEFGWEIRLLAGRDVVATAVCGSQDEVLTTSEQWKRECSRKAGVDWRCEFGRRSYRSSNEACSWHRPFATRLNAGFRDPRCLCLASVISPTPRSPGPRRTNTGAVLGRGIR
jgi:hypothetical protein